MSKMQIEGFPTTIPFDITIGDAAADKLTMSGYITGTTDGTTLDIIPTAGDYLRIGDAGTTSQSLNTNDDLFVSGKFEVDGASYFDGAATFASQITFPINVFEYFGGGPDAWFAYRTTQTPDTFMLGLNTTSRGIVICDYGDSGYDFAHAQQSNPTLFINSANQSATEWISFAHDQTHGVIATGGGSVDITSPIKEKSSVAITAAADGLQGSQALTATINHVTVCGTACNCVTLPGALTGATVWISNSGAQTLQIWPASGDTLGAGTDTGKTLASSRAALFMGIDTTTYLPILGANLL